MQGLWIGTADQIKSKQLSSACVPSCVRHKMAFGIIVENDRASTHTEFLCKSCHSRILWIQNSGLTEASIEVNKDVLLHSQNLWAPFNENASLAECAICQHCSTLSKGGRPKKYGRRIVRTKRPQTLVCSDAPAPQPLDIPGCSDAPAPPLLDIPGYSDAPAPQPLDIPGYSDAPAPPTLDIPSDARAPPTLDIPSDARAPPPLVHIVHFVLDSTSIRYVHVSIICNIYLTLCTYAG